MEIIKLKDLVSKRFIELNTKDGIIASSQGKSNQILALLEIIAPFLNDEKPDQIKILCEKVLDVDLMFHDEGGFEYTCPFCRERIIKGSLETNMQDIIHSRQCGWELASRLKENNYQDTNSDCDCTVGLVLSTHSFKEKIVYKSDVHKFDDYMMYKYCPKCGELNDIL